MTIRSSRRDRDGNRRERGQALALFVLLSFVIIGAVAIVTDISWFWANSLKVQRAADAAALAGAIYLPGNPSGAYAIARAEATKNGYTGGAGVTVTPSQDAQNPRRLDVTITAPVNTFFAQIFGLRQINVTQNSRAEYTLPVPMGSPQSYFGIYNLIYKSGTSWATKSVTKAPGASGSTSLASQGFWAAVLTRGGQRQNGDAYSPENNGSGSNADYDPEGYGYTVEFGAGTTTGRVYLYDATFCAVGHHDSGSYLGTGDHWLDDGGAPVSTDYILWNTRATPYNTADDIQVATSGTRFSNENQADKSTAYKGDGLYGDDGYTGSSSSDCQSDTDHNNWYLLAQNLTAGTYRLQVKTSSNGNINTNAENMFGIQAVANGSATAYVHGTDRMAMYNNRSRGADAAVLIGRPSRPLRLPRRDAAAGSALLLGLSAGGEAPRHVSRTSGGVRERRPPHPLQRRPDRSARRRRRAVRLRALREDAPRTRPRLGGGDQESAAHRRPQVHPQPSPRG